MSLSAPALVGVLRAAGEITRLRVLALLAGEELAVMELGGILRQSQPRVSRHLRLLTEQGLVERFPDGAWVFYRLSAAGPARRIVDDALSRLDPDDEILLEDRRRLEAVRRSREAEAAAYFARNAARWDEIRSLHVDEAEVEAAVLRVVGDARPERLVDLGTGSGRMLTLLGPSARRSLGLDLSQQMLNIARRNVAAAGVDGCELRHGDMLATGLESGWADLVVIHSVLHFLADPQAALLEAARLVSDRGRLLIIDYAPHELEQLRQLHQHRRLGFSDEEVGRWLSAGGLRLSAVDALPPRREGGLTVKIWRGEPERAQRRSAA